MSAFDRTLNAHHATEINWGPDLSAADRKFLRWLTRVLIERSHKKLGESLCILCQFPTSSRGVFFPTEPQKWGGIQSKQRAIAYPLCESCADAGDWERVEKALKQHMAVEAILQ